MFAIVPTATRSIGRKTEIAMETANAVPVAQSIPGLSCRTPLRPLAMMPPEKCPEGIDLPNSRVHRSLRRCARFGVPVKMACVVRRFQTAIKKNNYKQMKRRPSRSAASVLLWQRKLFQSLSLKPNWKRPCAPKPASANIAQLRLRSTCAPRGTIWNAQYDLV